MISRDEVLANLGRYDQEKARIGVLASHSSLDTCDGAVSEGFRTLAVCQKGRERTFNNYFRSQRDADGNLIRTRGLDADQTESAIKATFKMLNLIEH